MQSEKAMKSGKGAKGDVVGCSVRFSSSWSPGLQGSRGEEIPEIQS